MVNSSAYIDFKKQLKAKGREKLDGYNPDLFNLIRADERKEIEKDIYDSMMPDTEKNMKIWQEITEKQFVNLQVWFRLRYGRRKPRNAWWKHGVGNRSGKINMLQT